MKLLTMCLLICAGGLFSMSIDHHTKTESSRLAVLWTSGDPEVASKVCFMYTLNAKKQGWFDDVVLIVWGPSAKVLADNEELQAGVKKMIDAGVVVKACITCAKMYNVDQQLAEMGIDVKGMGVPLSNYLKQGWKTLNF